MIGESFTRIFKQNMFNCGMLTVQLSLEPLDGIFERFADRETVLETDREKKVFVLKADGAEETFSFEISGFYQALVEAGGWVGYADSKD